MGRQDTPPDPQNIDTMAFDRFVSQRDTHQEMDPLAVSVTMATPRKLRVPERYERGDLLGEGGMGHVWLCQDQQIGRRVAMKVLKSEVQKNFEAETRFVREARVQGQLEHPSVVPVYDLGVDAKGATFFTMRRVRGVTLEEIVTEQQQAPGVEGPYSRRRLLTAFSQVCLAVDYCHRRGVLHRDLKPANIMLGDFGEVYVLDWGISKVLSETDPNEPALDSKFSIIDTGDQTPDRMTKNMLGTPGFMSPEQMQMLPSATLPTTDVYSLGSILFEFLTLLPLHPGQSWRECASTTLTGVDARPSVRAPHMEIPPELDEICVRATALDPSDRYRSTREMHEAIERYLDGERDAELRQNMAHQHSVRAVTLLNQAKQGGPSALATRQEAFGEIGKALALDPSNQEALQTMVQMLTDPPKETPAEVQREMQRSREKQYRWTGLVAGIAYCSMLLYLPLFFWSGIKSTAPVVLYYALSLLAGGLAFATWRSKRPKVRFVFAAMIVSTLSQASTGMFFGPLILPPMLVATNMAGYSVVLDGWRRAVGIAFACLVIYLLVLLDLLGVPASYYVFSEAGMLVKPSTIGMSVAPTFTFLCIVAMATIITTTVCVAYIRDSLTKAERKLFTYTWQIRQLVPATAESTGPMDLPTLQD